MNTDKTAFEGKHSEISRLVLQVQVVDRNHQTQILHYLKAIPLEVGSLMNFGARPEYKRFVFDKEEEKIRVHPCESVVGL